MAQTASTAFSAAITFSVQTGVLQNLRNDLLWANPQMAESGTFNKGSDTIMFIAVPDLSNTTPQTPLTEGSAPNTRNLTITPTSFSTNQYGDLVQITDLAKVKSPVDIVTIGVERVSRVAAEVIDVITRDTIFLSGTPFYSTVSVNTVRTDIATTDLLTGNALFKLRSTMKKNKIPTFPDGTYHLYISPQQHYDLKTDTSTTTGWLEPGKYTESGREAVMSGEVAKFAGFHIMEVNNVPTFSSTTTVYAGLATGPVKGWGAGSLQTFQTYHVTPGGDHYDPLGQVELLGWKVDFGVGVLSNTYFYRLETAATTL